MRAALLGLALAACGGGSAPPPPSDRPADTFDGDWSPIQGSEVVAIVNGEELFLADVERLVAATGKDPRAALDDLVAQELLAQEARRRGLDRAPEVVEARRRERARVLVERAFAPTFDGPEDVPDDEVERTYNHPQVHSFYNHQKYHVVSYVRVPAEKGRASAAEVARAREVADAIHAAAIARRPPTGEAFLELGREVGAKLGATVETNHRYPLTRRNTAVEEFAAPAFSIDEPGEIADPALTAWGWDVIYLDEILPERKTPLAEAAPEIRARRFEAAREAAFLGWVAGFARGARIAVADGLDQTLATIEVAAPVALP